MATQIGSGGVTVLANGNYLVKSPLFAQSEGAVTWGSEATGINGIVSASNSLVGNASGDSIGSGGIFQLSNQANYLVLSPLFNGGAGAVTNGSDATGITGVVSSENSLVGAAPTDGVGTSGSILDSDLGLLLGEDFELGRRQRGAVTWNSDTAGTVGEVSASNSLVGTIDCDRFHDQLPTRSAAAESPFSTTGIIWSNRRIGAASPGL